MRWARAALPVLVASQLLPAAAASPQADAARFDSSRAFEHIRQLVAIGPRPAGSPGNEQARAYIADQLKALGLSPTLQQFSAETPLGTTKMANVVVKIPGADAGRILITGHFDTKLFRQFRFVGANDGGSSAAMLLELARVLKDRKNPYTIELVFFDGEEATLPEWTGTDHTYGSRHYVETGKADGSLAKIRAMILFDMVADQEPEHPPRDLLDALADGSDLGLGEKARPRRFVRRRRLPRRGRPQAVPRCRRPLGGHHRPGLLADGTPSATRSTPSARAACRSSAIPSSTRSRKSKRDLRSRPT